MDPRKPSELIPYLRQNDLLPKRSLSQNFLTDLNIIRKIVNHAAVSKGERILEIGPGPGGLTKTLLEVEVGVIEAVNPVSVNVVCVLPLPLLAWVTCVECVAVTT